MNKRTKQTKEQTKMADTMIEAEKKEKKLRRMLAGILVKYRYQLLESFEEKWDYDDMNHSEYFATVYKSLEEYEDVWEDCIMKQLKIYETIPASLDPTAFFEHVSLADHQTPPPKSEIENLLLRTNCYWVSENENQKGVKRFYQTCRPHGEVPKKIEKWIIGLRRNNKKERYDILVYCYCVELEKSGKIDEETRELKEQLKKEYGELEKKQIPNIGERRIRDNFPKRVCVRGCNKREK